MARCCGYIISDTGYKIVSYGWLVLASAIFVAGTIMSIVGTTQGANAANGLDVAGVFMMIIGGILGVWWICWKCKCGCCADNDGCCELTNSPAYI